MAPKQTRAATAEAEKNSDTRTANPVEETTQDQTGDGPEMTLDLTGDAPNKATDNDTDEAEIRKLEERREALTKERRAARLAELRKEVADLESPQGHKRSGSDSLETPEGKDGRPADPPPYFGRNIAEHRNFVRACTNAFVIAPRRFSADAPKVNFAMQFLRGEAREAWFTEYEDMKEGAQATWEGFKTSLLDQISDPVNRTMEAASRYQSARQQPNQSVQAFATELAIWEAQLTPYTEEQQVQHLFSKLKREIRQTLTNYREVPKTRAALVSLASTVERNIAGSTPSTVRTNPTGPMAPRNPSVNEGPPTCYNCWRTGHIARHCRSETRPRPENMPPAPPRVENPNHTPVNHVSGKGRAS